MNVYFTSFLYAPPLTGPFLSPLPDFDDIAIGPFALHAYMIAMI